MPGNPWTIPGPDTIYIYIYIISVYIYKPALVFAGGQKLFELDFVSSEI
jgi:hypothetical protein